MRTEYILMNQTAPMLRFSCEHNIFDEPEFEESEWMTEIRPIGYGNLNDFFSRRQASRNLCDVSGYRDVASSEKTSKTTETNLLSPALPGFV